MYKICNYFCLEKNEKREKVVNVFGLYLYKIFLKGWYWLFEKRIRGKGGIEIFYGIFVCLF